MNPEIENCLSALRDRPLDAQILRTLENHVRSETMSDDLLQVMAHSLEHHQRRREWEAVVGLIDLQLDRVQKARRLELLGLKGRILEEELLDEDGALESFQRVLELEPDNLSTREAVDHIQLIRDNWEKVARKYIEEAEAVADSDRQLSTSLFLSAAEVIWRNAPDDPRVEQYLRRSLEVEPRNGRASAHLERLFRRRGALELLGELYEQRADVAATREERVAAFLAAGELWADELGSLEQAATRYRRALSLDPSNPRALKHLIQTLTTQENWTALVRFYEEALRGRPQGPHELQILLQMGTLYNDRLAQPDQAEEYYRRVRRVDPANEQMLDFYRGYFQERGELSKLLPLLDSAQRTEQQVERRIQLAQEMAQVAEEQAGNLEKAIDIWKGIQRMDPGSSRATVALKRLYRQTQPPKWNALRELIKEEIDGLGSSPEEVEQQVRLLLEVVEIYRDHLKLDVMVINTYNAILTLQPHHAQALQALTEKYEALGRWNDLIGLLLRRKEVETDPRAKIQTLHRVASLWIDRFGNQTQAITPLQDVLAIDPTEPEALARLKEIFHKRRNWRELMDVLRLEVRHVEESRRRELFSEMARLAADRLGDAREGIQVWNQVLAEEDPADPEALEQLTRLYRREERWPALAEVLHRRVEVIRERPEGRAEAVELLEQLGEIYTNRVRAVENAINVWDDLLTLDPGHGKARAVLRELLVQEQRWEALERLFVARGEYSELAETLTTAADRTDDRELKMRLYRRVGEICRDRLDHPDRAMKAFERVLALSPQDVGVARALVTLYQQAGRWGRLLSCYEVLFEQARDPDDKLELVEKIRQLHETELDSKQLAFQWSARAFAIDPDGPQVRAEMERLAAQSDSWEELVEIYVARLPEIEDPASKATLLRHLAHLCSEKLHRPEDAEAFHVDLLEIHPDDLPAMEALEQIYSSQQRWEGLVDIHRRRAALETDEEGKQSFLFKAAFIQEERLGDPLATIQTLTEILEIDGANLKALRWLARLNEVRGEWFPLVDVLQRLLGLAQTRDEKVEILHRMGDVLQTNLDAPEEGIESLAEALEYDPRHRGTIRALERHLVVDSPFRIRVATLLQPVYERAEDFEKLVQAIQILLASEEDRDARLTLLRRLMTIQQREFGELEAAFASGSSILALDPADREIRPQMALLAEQLGRVDELAELLVDALAHLDAEATDHQLELTLSWELALLLDEQLGRPEEAERHLRRILELRPDHPEAYDMLERILRDAGEWTGLRDLLQRRRADATDPEVIRDILLQVCALNENVLEDVSAAIAAYEEILDLEPDNLQAFKALERHYTDEGRHGDLFNLLRREMDAMGDAQQRRQLKLAQADLLVHRLGQASAAVDLLQEVVQEEPTSEPAVALLEHLLGLEGGADGRRITEILEPVYHGLQGWSDLIRILLRRRALSQGATLERGVEHARGRALGDDRFEAVDLLCRAAVLTETELENQPGAFALYREALTCDAAALNVHQEVRRLAGELEAWTEAVESWKQALEAADADDLALRGQLLMWLAETHDERLEDTPAARTCYEQLLELDPQNLETARPSALALARIYEQQGAWKELVSVLRTQLTWAELGTDRREEILLRVGRIQEEVLGDAALAAQTYSELLDEKPGCDEALDALERLYLQSERWEDLVRVYRRRVERADSAEERRLHLVRIAALYEEELDDPDQAVAAFLSILDELPQDAESIRALARIYRGAERWPDLLEMLERDLALTEEQDECVSLLFEAATVEHVRLLEPAVAIDRYRRILEVQPRHDGTRQALEQLLQDVDHRGRVAELLMPVYRDESDWERLIRVHELLVEPAVPSERMRHLREVARLCEDGLQDMERAFDALRQAVREAAAEPDLLELVREYRRVAGSLKRWDEYILALEQMVVDVLDPEARTWLHHELATVSRDELQDLERSSAHFHQVLDGDPNHTGALEALDAICLQTKQWEGLLEILSRRVELAEADQDRRDLLVRSAFLCRDRLDRPSEAIAALENVLELRPADDEAIAALQELYGVTDRWVELADLLERKLERTEDTQERAQLYARIGRLRAEKLEDEIRAVEAYREVLLLDSSNEEVVSELERYLEQPSLQAEAARILQPYYVRRQDWNRLIRIYQIRLDAAQDPEERLAVTTRIAQLYEEQLEDLEGAFTWYSKVYLEKPSDVAIRDQILRLAGILDRWEEVSDVLARHMDQTLEENETTREAALILGGIYDERLFRVDQAVACYRRVLDADAMDRVAFDAMESLLTRAERWDDLLTLYRDTTDATEEPEARRELMLKICRVWEEALYNLPEAIDAYRGVLDMSERDAEAVEALDRLYTESEQWHDLCDLLVRQIELTQDQGQILELRYRLGTIYELRLQDLPAAIDYFEEVLKADRANGRAVSALERLILDKEQRYRIAQILEPIYREQDEWAKLVVIYDAQLDFIDDPERRGHLLREIARLHEDRGGSLDLAFRALSRAFEEEFGDESLLQQIESLASRLNNWSEVVQVLLRGVERVYDNELLARMHSRVATLLEQRMGDQAGAVDAWRQVLAAREDHEAAMENLTRLLGTLERHEELVEVLQRKGELTFDLPIQKQTYFRIAQIHETMLQRPGRAIEAYRQVLALDETDATSLDALERLYSQGENWMELVGVYRQKLELSQDREARRRLQLAVARVYDEKVKDAFEAIATYRELMDADPTDREILQALDRLYSAEGLHNDLLEVLQRKIEAEQDPQERTLLIFRAGQLLERELSDVERAVERYREVLGADPAHAGAREALQRLVQDEGHREVAAQVLEQLYEKTDEVQPLVQLLELRLELVADPQERRDLLVRMARLAQDGLHDPSLAFSTFARAFNEVPGDEEVQRELERLATQQDSYAELVQVYGRRLNEIYDTLLARTLHLRVARLAEEVLQDDATAVKHYRSALEASGDDIEILAALDSVLQRMGRWDELVEIVEREVQLVLDPAAQSELFHRMGVVRMREHQDLDGAFSAFSNALQCSPGHAASREAMAELLSNETYRPMVLDVLEPLYEDAGEHRRLVELLEIRLGTLGDPTERTILLQRMAQIHEQHLGSKDDALGALGRALAEDPGNEEVLREAERLADALGRYVELAALADEILGGEVAAEAARTLGLRTAHWHGTKLNDIERSERTLRRVLEVDPQCATALDGLEQIYRAGSDAAELCAILERRAEVEVDGARRRSILTELARVRADELNDADGAIEAWRLVLEQDAMDCTALEALIPLYEAKQAHAELLEILERQAQAAAEIEDQLAIKHRMGALLVQQLQDPVRAVELYRDILDRDPGDSRALDALERLHTESEDHAALQEVLMWRRCSSSWRACRCSSCTTSTRPSGTTTRSSPWTPAGRRRCPSWSARCARPSAGTTWWRCTAGTRRPGQPWVIARERWSSWRRRRGCGTTSWRTRKPRPRCWRRSCSRTRTTWWPWPGWRGSTSRPSSGRGARRCWSERRRWVRSRDRRRSWRSARAAC